MSEFRNRLLRSPSQLVFELLLALLLTWATVMAPDFMAHACDAQLPAVASAGLPADTETVTERKCR